MLNLKPFGLFLEERYPTLSMEAARLFVFGRAGLTRGLHHLACECEQCKPDPDDMIPAAEQWDHDTFMKRALAMEFPADIEAEIERGWRR